MSAFHDDWYLKPIAYPNDADGNPRYGPENPAHPSWQRMTYWGDLGRNGEYLRSTATKIVYVHPNNNKIWHLAGPGRGREGVALAKELEGVLMPEFEILYSGGPYLIGAKPERVDYKKRTISLGVHVQPNGNAERPEEPNPFSYRLIEDQWWQSWSETVPGYLGFFTRTHGWRWLAVILADSKTKLSIDPVAHDNNSQLHNFTIHAPYPFFSKRALTRKWVSTLDNVTQGGGTAKGVLSIANRGTWGAWPKFLLTGTGQAFVQDGIDGQMIKLPKMYDTDGSFMLVDTDPTKRTITTEQDPHDEQLFKYLRNSQLAQILFKDETAKRLPAQRRIPGGIGFDGEIPPRTVAHLKVTHTNPNATITCIMPQQYRMAWS